MQETLRRMQERRADGDRGFTLIELLVVVVIIGVLVAIAIPLYLNYRKGAANKSAAADVRGAITAVEQFYSDNGNIYPANVNGVRSTNLTFAVAGGITQTATVSTGNTLYFRNTANTSYVICGQNVDGEIIYVYNSLTGGSVRRSTRGTLEECADSGL
jgi:type IV pilus assembly protein PilA